MLASRGSAVTAAATRIARRALATGAGPYGRLELYDNSRVPTYAFQDSLPRLPIPKLDETLDKYLYFVEPLIDTATLESTKVAVQEFRVGAGPKLQHALVSKDDHHPETSYVADIWMDMYLKNRDPFPLNLTPYLSWKPHADPAKNEQAARSADLVAAAVRFQRSLEAQALNPDIWRMQALKYPLLESMIVNFTPAAFKYYPMYFMKAYPLDMHQYPRLFYTTRLPRQGKDELKTYDYTRHIIVQRGAAIYKVNVLDEKFLPLTPEQIEAQLRGVLSDDTAHQGHAVGSLTTLDRNTWATERAALEHSKLNAKALHDIDSAMFVLTLEDEVAKTQEEGSRLMLHGGGRNRWFDKSFNITVCKDGKAGIAWEHSWGDGVAVLNFFDKTYEEINAVPARPAASAVMPTKVRFDLTPASKTAIANAEARMKQQAAECDLKMYATDALTKSDVKKSGLSPDGVMQMAMQLAHFRTHGYTPSTYESASTAGFKHGRTETIRSASPASVKFVETFCNPEASPLQKHQALKAATEQHSKTTRDALTGKGIDRHLSALEEMGRRAGVPNPAIFTDKGMQVMRDIRLSTSTLASPALDAGGFGPVSRTSYGIGYSTEDRGCGFHVMSYGLDTAGLCDNLGKALQEMKEVMVAYAPAPKPAKQ